MGPIPSLETLVASCLTQRAIQKRAGISWNLHVLSMFYPISIYFLWWFQTCFISIPGITWDADPALLLNPLVEFPGHHWPCWGIHECGPGAVRSQLSFAIWGAASENGMMNPIQTQVNVVAMPGHDVWCCILVKQGGGKTRGIPKS